MKIGIVVINWNGLDLLKKYLKVLIQNSVNHNVYVIDNNSEDESVSCIRKNHNEVKIMALQKAIIVEFLKLKNNSFAL